MKALGRYFFFAARLVFCALFLSSAVYCLLAYLPFTYHQVIEGKLLDWLPGVISVQPFLQLVAVLLCAITYLPELKEKGSRGSRPALVFLGALIVWTLAVMIRPVLSRLGNDRSSLAWAFLYLLPIAGAAALDVIRCGRRVNWREGTDNAESQRLFVSLVASAGFIVLLHFVVACLRAEPPSWTESTTDLLYSSASHLVLFLGAFALLVFTRAVASVFSTQLEAELIGWNVLGSFALGLTIYHVVLGGLTFTGPLAALFAALMAVAVVAFVTGSGIRASVERREEVGTSLAVLLLPLTFGRVDSWWSKACWLVGIAAATWVVSSRVAVFDWNFLFQELFAAFTWLFTFAVLYPKLPRNPKRDDWSFALLLLALFGLVGYRTVVKAAPYLGDMLGDEKLDTRAVLAGYTGKDISYRLVSEILATRAPATTKADPEFYAFLQRNTNIPKEIPTKPVDIKLVDNLSPSKGEHPNIFIVVLDSLRRDYLGVYNHAVKFTPALDRFAAENIAFENVFTRYGATGLAEPSIWVGGMMLHKQYVTPFAPMNNLKKLVKAEGYVPFISMDSILQVILDPWPEIEELDPGVSTQQLEACRSLERLEQKLMHRLPGAPPVFAYTQPQNIHISVINREGGSVPPGEAYPGFYAPYASRLHRVDECFGKFVDFLKRSKLYDESIVIFTADHGDSLGEEGRYGHAYTIFPEILRIPLLVHLPNPLKQKVVWDSKALTFSADITPSLYFLLGHPPKRPAEFFGKSQFASHPEELVPYRDDKFMVASSYGAVYGLLSKEGNSIYIADGVNFKDYYYEILPDGYRKLDVTSEMKADSEKRIRAGVLSLDKFYQFEQKEAP